MNIKIVKAKIEDLPDVYSFELESMLEVEPENVERWKDALPKILKQWITNLSTMFMLQVDGENIGHCFWQMEEDSAVLASIFVLQKHRRSGMATLLLQAFEDDAEDHGFSVLKLGVLEDNPANYFYRKNGYQFIHLQDGYNYYSKTCQ